MPPIKIEHFTSETSVGVLVSLIENKYNFSKLIARVLCRLIVDQYANIYSKHMLEIWDLLLLADKFINYWLFDQVSKIKRV